MNSKRIPGFATLLLCSMVGLAPAAIAQPNSTPLPVNRAANVTITPGRSIGAISLGQSMAAVQQTLGRPLTRRSFEQEQELFTQAGRDVDRERLFQQGFDWVLEYSQSNNRGSYPIYKVYFKNDRAVQINLSIFMYSAAIAQGARLKGTNLGLLSDRATMERAMGKNYFFYNDDLSFQTFEYLQQGISFLIDDGKIATILLYEPLSAAEQNRFIRKRSSQT
jgi:hypothetical protein